MAWLRRFSNVDDLGRDYSPLKRRRPFRDGYVPALTPDPPPIRMDEGGDARVIARRCSNA